MKPLTNTQLNRIKIKDLMAAIKSDLDLNSVYGLFGFGTYDRIEKRALVNATDDDLKRIEQLFIRKKLKIQYYPSQNKKVIIENGESKVVELDYHYGSNNA